MRKTFILYLLVSCMSLAAQTVGSFEDLTAMLEAGKQVTITLDLERCMDKPGMPKGYFMPAALMHTPATDTAPEHISTSNMQFTEQSGVPTYEYVKYTFNPDGTVDVKVSFYDPKTFKVLGSHKMVCQLGGGVNVLAQ